MSHWLKIQWPFENLQYLTLNFVAYFFVILVLAMFALDSILTTSCLLSLSLTDLSSALASFLALPLVKKSIKYLLPCTYHNDYRLVNAFLINYTVCSCHIFYKKIKPVYKCNFPKRGKVWKGKCVYSRKREIKRASPLAWNL